MTIKIKKSEQSALVAVCGLRLVYIISLDEDTTTDLAFVNLDIDTDRLPYLMKEFGEMVAQERQFNETADRVGGSFDNAFKMLSDFNRPNC